MLTILTFAALLAFPSVAAETSGDVTAGDCGGLVPLLRCFFAEFCSSEVSYRGLHAGGYMLCVAYD